MGASAHRGRNPAQAAGGRGRPMGPTLGPQQASRRRAAPSTLIWDIHRFLKTENLPARRTVLHVEFTDLKNFRLWWLVVQEGQVDVCLDDPGYEVDLTIRCEPLTLTQVFMGDLPIARAQASARLELAGDSQPIKSMPRWFGLMPFSSVEPGIAVATD